MPPSMRKTGSSNGSDPGFLQALSICVYLCLSVVELNCPGRGRQSGHSGSPVRCGLVNLAGMKRMLHALLLTLLLSLAAHAQEQKPATAAIEKLAWLAGSWRMERAGRVVEEQWMAPAAGVMLGMSRTVAKGRVVEHEFIQIRVGPGGDLFFIAQPSGQKEATFQHTALADNEVVFENPNHDFPQKITYTRKADGSLLATVEGLRADGTVRRVEFAYQRVK